MTAVGAINSRSPSLFTEYQEIVVNANTNITAILYSYDVIGTVNVIAEHIYRIKAMIYISQTGGTITTSVGQSFGGAETANHKAATLGYHEGTIKVRSGRVSDEVIGQAMYVQGFTGSTLQYEFDCISQVDTIVGGGTVGTWAMAFAMNTFGATGVVYKGSWVTYEDIT